jgi:hypothetical protein
VITQAEHALLRALEVIWVSSLLLPTLLTIGAVAWKRVGRRAPLRLEDLALGFDLALAATGIQLAALSTLAGQAATRLTAAELDLGFALLGALVWYLVVLALWMRHMGYDDEAHTQPRLITGVAIPTGFSMLGLIAVYAANASLLGS